MHYTFNWSVLWREPYGSLIVDGFKMTLYLSLTGWVGALVFGTLVGFGRIVRSLPIRALCTAYVGILRNVPVLLQLFFWYFAFPVMLPRDIRVHLYSLGWEVGSAIVALALYTSSRVAEHIRSGIRSVEGGIRLAALILAMVRRLPEARDNQAKHHWRGMISDLNQREDELSGKTLLIIGLGGIGGRLAQLAKAFDIHIIGIRQDPSKGGGQAADSVHKPSELKASLRQADYVALTCPLTKETERVIDADALSCMKKSAYLINAARGRCVDEDALIKALRDQKIAGAAIDVSVDEPLPAASPLLEFSKCPDYTSYSGRDAKIRRKRHRYFGRELGPALAWRKDTA
jgi:His/Glu/Gln/Arg/opine family amino acid ABC transporter permease subunit